MVPRSPPDAESYVPDPVYLHARREAIEILAGWAVALVWTVGYCAVRGYRGQADPADHILGMPSWVYWGVFIPWIASTIFMIAYSLLRMKDDPLEARVERHDSPPESEG